MPDNQTTTHQGESQRFLIKCLAASLVIGLPIACFTGWILSTKDASLHLYIGPEMSAPQKTTMTIEIPPSSWSCHGPITPGSSAPCVGPKDHAQ